MQQLTTIENVKSYLGIGTDVDDELLEQLVGAASQFIQTWLNRQFGRAPYADTFDGTGGRVWMFRNYPVARVSAVTVNGQSIPAYSAAHPSGYKFDDKRLVLEHYVFDAGLLNCSVSYLAGPDVTPDIDQACVELVAARYREKDRVGLVSKGLAGETTAFSQKDMPDSVKTLLRNYKKVVPN